MSLPPRWLLFALFCCACSTELSPLSEFADDPASATPAGAKADAGAPPHAERDASAPFADAARPPVRRDAAAPLAPTGPSQTDAGPASSADAASCALHNDARCPAVIQTPSSPCAPALRGLRCGYPFAPGNVVQQTCNPQPSGALVWSDQVLPCPRNCRTELPHAFEELEPSCDGRGVQACDQGFLTDQQAVDETLARLAEECGMANYHLGVILSASGCARALFSQEIRAPEIRCIGARLNKIRFGCAPVCAIAASDFVR